MSVRSSWSTRGRRSIWSESSTPLKCCTFASIVVRTLLWCVRFFRAHLNDSPVARDGSSRRPLEKCDHSAVGRSGDQGRRQRAVCHLVGSRAGSVVREVVALSDMQ
jgi:hypothetical protein